MADAVGKNSTSSMDDPAIANYDAEQMVEDIQKDDDKAPKVNVDADYERSKQFDTAESDNGVEGSQATGSKSGEGAGDPQDFLDMAKQVTPKEDSK